MLPGFGLRAIITVLDPGYDLRTILTIAAVIPFITGIVYGAMKIFGRTARWVGGLIGDALVAIVVAAITKVLSPRLDATDGRLTEIEEVLVTVNDRIGVLEKRRRDDRPPQQGV